MGFLKNEQIPIEIRTLSLEELEETRAFGRLFNVKNITYRVQLKADDSLLVYIPKDKYS